MTGQAIPDTVVARTRQTSVLKQELLAWCALEKRNCVELEKLRHAAQDLVVRRELSRRFHESGLSEVPAFKNERTLILDRLAAALLPRHLASTLRQPEPEELRQLFTSIGETSRQRRWRVRNLYRRLPKDADQAQREGLKRGMSLLRTRIQQGEDFASLARQYSDSATGRRGGAIGMVTLDRLDKPIAEALASLGPGDLSPILETREGLTLLLVDEVIEPDTRSFEQAEANLRERWRKRQLEKLNKRLDARLLAETASDASTATDRRLLRARAIESRLLGLNKTPQAVDQERQAVEKLEAQLAANVLAIPLTQQPNSRQVRAFFDSRQRLFVRPRKRHLDSLKLVIDPALPAAFYQAAHELGELAAAGKIDFEQVERDLGTAVTRRDLGKLTDRQVWLLGLNVDHALRPLEVGQATSWMQEGQALHLVKVLSIEPETVLDFEQSKPQIEALLRTRAKKAAGKQLYASILKDLEFRFAAGFEPVHS